MTADRCDRWHGLIAMEVVGQLDPLDRTALEAHVEGCASCRDERAAILPLRPALATANPRHLRDDAMGLDGVDALDVPASLSDAVLGRLHAEARRDARRHRIRASVLTAAAAVLVALAVVAGLQPWHDNGARTVALSGEAGVHATVTVVPEAWGTRLQLVETGQPGGQILTVSMRSRAGRSWYAGSYRTVSGHTAHIDLACAVPASDVYAVYVSDAQGRTVLQAEPA